jgi:deoxyribodipyrimidine photolyase-related protein
MLDGEYHRFVNKCTVWVFGDQLNRHIGALRDAQPKTHRILMVESHSKIASRRWHVQRAHFIVTSMRRFAGELRDAGFEVDYRFAESMQQGVQLHIEEFAPSKVIATEPNSFTARTLISKLGIESVQSNQFLCHPDVYSDFLKGRKALKMEDFYRFQRKRLNVLVDGDNPVGDRWNFDEENRSGPPKKDQDRWPKPEVVALDELDAEVLKDVSEFTWGVKPTGQWATTRAGAIKRMNYFMQHILPMKMRCLLPIGT